MNFLLFPLSKVPKCRVGNALLIGPIVKKNLTGSKRINELQLRRQVREFHKEMVLWSGRAEFSAPNHLSTAFIVLNSFVLSLIRADIEH